MLDDSIVRGTTCDRIVSMLREAGAKEVHLRISSPPFTWPCLSLIHISTREELDTITSMTFRINDLLKEFFAKTGVELIDFKLEFGRCDGEILLADEISPDTCRFCDIKTHEKLDKDRFRRDMGGVEEAYAEMMKRVGLA